MSNIGLVCMRYKKGFKKGFTGIKQIEKATQQEIDDKLLTATLFNIDTTIENIQWCIDNKVGCYRVSSSIIPFPEFWDWDSLDVVQDRFEKVRGLAKKHDITLTIHPDQFTVLSSQSDLVVENSFKILDYHADLCFYMDIQHIILHIGSTKPNKKDALIRFAENFELLDKFTKDLIRVENCHSYSINELLELRDFCGVDLCFDLHHERVVNPDITPLELDNLLDEVFVGNNHTNTICHLSSGKKSTSDKSHSDYISDEDKAIFRDFTKVYSDCVFEIEAKCKDLAVLDFIKGE